jgi:hypothetical protein
MTIEKGLWLRPRRGRDSPYDTPTGGVAALNHRLIAVTPAGVYTCNAHIRILLSSTSYPWSCHAIRGKFLTAHASSGTSQLFDDFASHLSARIRVISGLLFTDAL